MNRFCVTGLLFLAASLAFGQGAPSADSESRFALVIGNGEYPNTPLKNPANDASDLAKALSDLGFSVSLVVDGDYAAMNRAIRDFGNAIKRPDAVALFYYSGHGVQYRGMNYLVPARADIQDADELPFSAINAEQVYAKMESAGAKTNIIILDACRNNPFPGAERAMERGLAVVGTIQPPQSLIVYATAPGKTAQDGEGRNGVFTAAFLKHLKDPGLDAELMIRKVREEVIAATDGVQVPWHNSSISGAGFSFTGGGNLLVSTDPPGAEVFVDGERRGISPLLMTDLPRFVEIEVSARSGSRSLSRRLTLADSAERRLDLELEVARGSILVEASETGARALIDGSPVSMDSSGRIEGVEIGVHQLELRGESSAFKAEVEVRADESVRLKAALLPMATLTLTLPPDSSCRIEGMGIDDTTSRWNYGSLPAGDYRMTVSGGDYEPLVETINLARGMRLDFAPKPRYTADYLNARYGAQLDNLRSKAQGGVASASDEEEARIILRQIKGEARPELDALASRADALVAQIAALRPAAGSPAALSGKSGGTLILESDPPGISVIVDSGETYTTPVSLELPSGAHSFEPLDSTANKTYYLGETKQWIQVPAGAEVSVPLRPKAARATLAFKFVPAGYEVFVDGEEVGTTPLAPIDVKAGAFQVRFERGSERSQVKNFYPEPGQTVIAAWGATREQAIELPRRTVKLDGKPDSWEGIDPLYESPANGATSFLDQEAFGLRRIYLCKDEKYLYWRVDFNETNPLYRYPKGTGKGTVLQIVSWLDALNKNFEMTAHSNRDANKTDSYLGAYDGNAKKWTELARNALTVKNAKDMFAARLELKWIEKHCGDNAGNSDFRIVNMDSNWKWVDSSIVQLKLGYINFAK